MYVVGISFVGQKYSINICSISTPWGQLMERLPMEKLHAQIREFWKTANISKTAAHRVKISSIATPWVERECMCNFWNFSQWPSFIPKYANFANRSVSWKRLPIEGKKSSISTPWGRKSVPVCAISGSQRPSLFYAKTCRQILNLPANSVF